MAGLVGYASSDEEDENSHHSPPSTTSPGEAPNSVQTANEVSNQKSTSNNKPSLTTPTQPSTSHEHPPSEPQHQPPAPPAQPTIGPTLGPSLPESSSTLPDLPEPSEPSSPYTATRTLTQDLTLPSIPNLDIPPSPPGSPPPQTTAKFQQFLTLKRQGTHFNSKLEQSAALRNPSLCDKLLSFVDLSGPAQYETTVSLDLYDPSGFPEWGYRDKLRKAREGVVKEKEREDKAGGRTIEFVGGVVSSNSPASTGGLSRDKRKSGWK